MGLYRGILLLGMACAGAGAVAASPSFDCTKADSSAEEAVCASDSLSAVDREMARLYGLAVNGPHMTADRLNELKAIQRGWIKGRNDCWKADIGLEPCIAQSYALRIHEIREGYADAREGEGASLGPFAYVCEGLDAPISAVFINAGDGMVSLKWLDSVMVLPRERSASGSRYLDAAGNSFWIKGDEAMMETPDGGSMPCRVDETG